MLNSRQSSKATTQQCIIILHEWACLTSWGTTIFIGRNAWRVGLRCRHVVSGMMSANDLNLPVGVTATPSGAWCLWDPTWSPCWLQYYVDKHLSWILQRPLQRHLNGPRMSSRSKSFVLSSRLIRCVINHDAAMASSKLADVLLRCEHQHFMSLKIYLRM